MKKFKWKINTEFFEEKIEDPKKIFQTSLLSAITLRYKDGLGYELHRRLQKILDKLESSEGEYLNLEDAEFSLIKDSFIESKFPPNVNKIINIYYDNIESVESQ